MPDTAIIKSAVLKIKQSGGPVGINPFTILGLLKADIFQGFFGSANTLELGDFDATASAFSVGTFGSTPVNGWYTATLNKTGRDQLNLLGLTQFRLYFTIDDNNNSAGDFMNFLSGNSTSGKPLLVIKYTLP